MPANDLTLFIRNVDGQLITEDADVLLTDITSNKLVRQPAKKGKLALNGLSAGPMVVYRVEVDPPSYLRATAFVGVTQGSNTVHEFVVAADPTKAKPEFLDFDGLGNGCCDLLSRSDSVLGLANMKGPALWLGLGVVQRAGLLNIICKCENTVLQNGRTVLSYLDKVYEVRGDRSFFQIHKDLREQVKSAATTGQFHEAPDNLHHPPAGFLSAGSWKTDDRYGNLQITFWSAGGDWRADIDIDDAGGLEHVFQVMRNHLTGLPTHPFAIHQILVRHQRLKPRYELVPA